MYDITIVGAGVSGIFLAYTLLQREEKLNVLIIEKGKSFQERMCPIEEGLSTKCVNCKICSKLQGFGGLGRSEGKFNYTNDFGGNLAGKVGAEEAMNLMEYVDEILLSFGGDKAKLYSTENKELSAKVEGKNIKVLTTKVRHLGTNLSYEILRKMHLYLKDKVEIKFETKVECIEKVDNVFQLKAGDNIFETKKVVLATGLSGGEEFLSYCKDFNIEPSRCRVDLGIRVEMKKDQLNAILKDSFETKLQYDDNELTATTYCMNPKGRIVRKYQEGLVMADGQNYLETEEPSFNLNFSVFIPKYFSSREEAKEYASNIISSINKEQGRIVVQRLEDLLKKQKTTAKSLRINSVVPTLAADGGNLYEEVPRLYIDGVLRIFDSIEKLIREKIDNDTLLYGLDSKFYEPEISTDKYFESREEGLYIIGDCSGTTYSLAQAAASGVYVGRHI